MPKRAAPDTCKAAVEGASAPGGGKKAKRPAAAKPKTAVDKIVAAIRQAREVVQSADGSRRFEPVSRAKIVKVLAADFGLEHKPSIKRAFLKAEADGRLGKVKSSFVVVDDEELAEDQEPDRVEEEEEDDDDEDDDDDDDERPYIPAKFARHGPRPFILHGKKKVPVSEQLWAEWLEDPDCEDAQYGACMANESISDEYGLPISHGCWMHDNFGGGYYGDDGGGDLEDGGDCPDCYLATKMRRHCGLD
eukprot:g3258.t1